MNINVLRLPEVKKMTGLSRSSIYAMVANKSFPKPIKLGERAVGWLETEVAEWIANKLQSRAS